MVEEHFNPSLFGALRTPMWLLLRELPLPLSQLPYLIIQQSVDPGLGKLSDGYCIVYPFVVQQRIEVLSL